MNNKKKAYCINCGKKQPYYVVKFSQKVTVRGTTFYYLETKAYCSECGKEVYVKEIADMNAQDRENAYNSYAHS